MSKFFNLSATQFKGKMIQLKDELFSSQVDKTKDNISLEAFHVTSKAMMIAVTTSKEECKPVRAIAALGIITPKGSKINNLCYCATAVSWIMTPRKKVAIARRWIPSLVAGTGFLLQCWKKDSSDIYNVSSDTSPIVPYVVKHANQFNK